MRYHGWTCLWVCVTVVLLVGCGSQLGRLTDRPGSKEAVVADQAIIGHFEMRDRTVTVKSGPDGPVYCVTDPAGRILAEDATIDQIRASDPKLYRLIQQAVTKGSCAAGSFLDAGIDHKPK